MQNQWFGDEGDFVKYTLLRRICGITAQNAEPPLPLGVVWYLRGSKRGYLHPDSPYEFEDRELFQRLRSWNQERERHERIRGIRLIEHSGLFPPDTSWFSELVPPVKGQREKWLQRALTAVRESRVVFLDPDTGLQPSSKGGGAHVLPGELEAFCSLPKQPTVVVYQHRRRERWRAQIDDQIKQVERLAGRDCFAVWHPELGRSFFYLIPCQGDRDLLRKRVQELCGWEQRPQDVARCASRNSG